MPLVLGASYNIELTLHPGHFNKDSFDKIRIKTVIDNVEKVNQRNLVQKGGSNQSKLR